MLTERNAPQNKNQATTNKKEKKKTVYTISDKLPNVNFFMQTFMVILSFD